MLQMPLLSYRVEEDKVAQEQQLIIKERKKRFRRSYSCQNCRSSKSKCNRSLPCLHCIQRGNEDTCTFGTSTTDQVSSTTAKRDETSLINVQRSQEMIVSTPSLSPYDINETMRSQDMSQQSSGYFASGHHGTPIDEFASSSSTYRPMNHSFGPNFQHRIELCRRCSQTSSQGYNPYSTEDYQALVMKNQILNDKVQSLQSTVNHLSSYISYTMSSEQIARNHSQYERFHAPG